MKMHGVEMDKLGCWWFFPKFVYVLKKNPKPGCILQAEQKLKFFTGLCWFVPKHVAA